MTAAAAPLLVLLMLIGSGPLSAQTFPAGVDPDLDGPLVFSFEPLPNFAEVSAAVYRSGDPNAGGFQLAKQKGIKTVLDLRLRDHDEDSAAAQAAGLRHVKVRMNGVYSPTFAQVDEALFILTDKTQAPFLVHCHFGKDRTGTVIAAYRVVVQGWSIEKAAAEARSYGCCAPFFIRLEDWLRYYVNHRNGTRTH